VKQNVTFNVVPTTNPDEAIGYARYVYNATTGIGMDVLKQIIEERVPVVNNDQVVTEKTIIRTARYECPCCNTDLTALVLGSCQGLMTEEWDSVEGLYRVSISPDHGNCAITVEKLTGTKIYEGRTAHYLPRPDFNANPTAKKEIDDRNRSLAELDRKNPGKVAFIGGIETGEDLGRLVTAAVKAFESPAK